MVQSRATQIFEALVAEAPTNARYKYDLAFAILEAPINRPDYRRARALLEEAVRAEPEVPEYRVQLARCDYGLASQPDAPEGGRADLARVRDLLEPLVKAGQATPDDRLLLATVYDDLGAAGSDAGRPDEALRDYRRAAAIRADLHRTYPVVKDFRPPLARSHRAIGSLLMRSGRAEEARAEFGRAR